MNLLNQKAKQLFQFIFANHCVLCKDKSHSPIALCAACTTTLPWINNTCQRCALPLTGNILTQECGQCLNQPPPFDRTLALFEYHPPIDQLINQFKFHGRLLNGHLFGALLTQKIQDAYANNTLPECIIPVPLHRKRLRERGYNQALELARPLAKKLNIPINRYDCQRVLNTTPQSQIPATERRKNLRNAFDCTPLSAKHIAIVDDVVTTTSTIRELSHRLRSAGAERIDIWCVARTYR